MFYESEFRGDAQDFAKCDIPGCEKRWVHTIRSEIWEGVIQYFCGEHGMEAVCAVQVEQKLL